MSITIQKKFLARTNKAKADSFTGIVIQVDKNEKFAVVNFNEEYLRVDFDKDPALFRAISKLGTELTFLKNGELDTTNIKVKKAKKTTSAEVESTRSGCSRLNEPVR